MTKRYCVSCDSTETYIDKTGRKHWRFYDGFWFCKKCWYHYFDGPIYHPKINAKWNPINNPKRVLFRKKRIILKENPRKGKCKICGKKNGDEYINNLGKKTVVETHIHHYNYRGKDPLKNGIEICNQCHGRYSVEKRWRN